MPLRLTALPALARVRRVVLLRRRALAALCVAAAVLTGWSAVSGPAAPTVAVVVAAHDLAAGQVVASDDLTVAPLPRSSVPDGTLSQTAVVGRTLAGPLRAGEPVTDVRLVTPGVMTGYPGLVAVPVRIPDAEVVSLLRVGDRIDLLATDPGGAGTEVVATGVPVVAVPDPATDPQAFAGTATPAGRLIVVGTTEGVSGSLADAAVRAFLSVRFPG